MKRNALLFYICTTLILLLLSLLNIQQPLAAEHPAEKWLISPRFAQIKNPVPSDSSSQAEGKLLFQKECQGCHRETGKGDGVVIADLTRSLSVLTFI